MADMSEIGRQRIELDGEWGLAEFSDFGKEYADLYAFFYGINYDVADEDGISSGRIEHAFTAYPWRGGWSATDFFQELRFAVPRRLRPRVIAIQFASPGYIDLQVVQQAAISVALIVAAITFSINRIHKTYRNIQEGIKEKKLGDIDVKRAQFELTRDQSIFINDSIDQLRKELNLEQDIEIIQALNTNRLATLKILLALYRRAHKLAKQQARGKIRLTRDTPPAA